LKLLGFFNLAICDLPVLPHFYPICRASHGMSQLQYVHKVICFMHLIYMVVNLSGRTNVRTTFLRPVEMACMT
jgi:hypothetical protein